MQTEEELKLLSNQARFISGIISGEIKFVGRERKELLQEIIDKGFDPIRGQGHTPVHQAVAGGEESPAEKTPAAAITSTSSISHSVPSMASTCSIF
ncbi:DNA topoisomerase 2 [Hordeum vulgare]|nr:DNA topoisomerase 2 [Hordeum vulgare]